MNVAHLGDLAPAFALSLVASLVVHSHLINAAKILDRRRRQTRRRAQAGQTAAKAAAFLADYTARLD